MAPARPRRKFGASQKDRIFFACLPDVVTAARIHGLAEEIKLKNDLSGTLILPDHLHVTLFHLGDWASLPVEIVELARKAAAEIDVPSFDVTFKRAGSFRNSTGVYPFVLTGSVPQWSALRTALGAALKKVGLGAATQSEFKPHVTLLRDEMRIKPTTIEPVTWTVKDFVLIHSLLGKTTHIHLGRWPLRGSI